MATTSKSPRAVVLAALATARRSLPAYSHVCSPKKFTQHQLFACLALKSFLKADYRGVVAHLEDHPTLCALLEIKFVPHFTTLQKASRRLLASAPAKRLLEHTIRLHYGRRRRVRSMRRGLDRPGVQFGQRLFRATKKSRRGVPKNRGLSSFSQAGRGLGQRSPFYSRDARGPRPEAGRQRVRFVGQRRAAQPSLGLPGGRRRLRLRGQSSPGASNWASARSFPPNMDDRPRNRRPDIIDA